MTICCVVTLVVVGVVLLLLVPLLLPPLLLLLPLLPRLFFGANGVVALHLLAAVTENIALYRWSNSLCAPPITHFHFCHIRPIAVTPLTT